MSDYLQVFGPTYLPGAGTLAPVVFWEDFLVGYTGVDAALANESDPTGIFSATADRGEWLYTADAGGTDPVVQDDADGGWVLMKSDGDSGDQCTIQLNGESFFLTKGRRLYYQARLKVDVVTQDALWGLSVNTTDPLGTTPSDYVAFELDGDADLEFVADTGSAGTAQTDTGSNVAADTFAVYTFEWDGKDQIRAYVDGVKVHTTKTTIPTDKYLSPFFTCQSAGAELTMTIDYVLVVNERG